jgi:SpoVK/Ycf46/Vps4 family AAA+-type ATPase
MASFLTKVLLKGSIETSSIRQQDINELAKEIEEIVKKASKKLRSDTVYIYILVESSKSEKQRKKINYKLYNFENIINKDIDKFLAFKAILNTYFERLNNKIRNLNSTFNTHIIISPLPIEEKEIKDSSYKTENGHLELGEKEMNYFTPTEPLYTLDKVILRKETKEEILKTLHIIKKRHILYEEWGFKEVEPNPKVILNFYGPPGTGKTMAAHAIASHLNMKILALNYADIESKYVGEAPKNLIRAFKTAEKMNALLFFDEADSFLGKRITSVSSSADQSVNSLRSQMLILLESFNGIVIFATNLIRNYDRAFETRIFKHIKFELPDKELRKELIRSLIPSKVPIENPLNDHDIELLATISEGFSGRDIKNAIRDALISAIYDNQTVVNFRYFEAAFRNYAENKRKLNEEIFDKEKPPLEIKKKIEEKIRKSLNKE